MSNTLYITVGVFSPLDASERSVVVIAGDSHGSDWLEYNNIAQSWGFKCGIVRCGIWNYAGSADRNEWSFFGPSSIMEELFPGHVK